LPFFFRAEDGIRGRNVTGVQTCALPISLAAVQPAAPPIHSLGVCGSINRVEPQGLGVLLLELFVADLPHVGPVEIVRCPASDVRSEERRVGKEWGRWGGRVEWTNTIGGG